MSEVKNPSTYKEQIEILKRHGCHIEDEERAIRILSEIGYYRLSAYLLPFKNNKCYAEGTSIENVYKIYEFDRKLRNVLYSAIEIVEIYMRSSLSYYHAHKYGALGYLDAASYNKNFNADEFEEKFNREVRNNQKVLFVKHHLENYGGKFPLWVASELFTFGSLSYFYSDLKTCDKKELAGRKFNSVASWLRCCTDLRNICAHYGRLYYRIFPSVPSDIPLHAYQSHRLWGAVLALKSLFPSNEKWLNEFMPNMEALFEEYKDDIQLWHVAFPYNWADILKDFHEFRFLEQ